MKKILIVFGVLAMVVASCGVKSNDKSKEAKEETPAVEEVTEYETVVTDSLGNVIAEDDSLVVEGTEAEAPEAQKEDAE